MPLLPSECPNCGRLHSGHSFTADPGPLQRQIAQLTEALELALVMMRESDHWYEEELAPIVAVLAGEEDAE